jgi:phosphate transport system protein
MQMTLHIDSTYEGELRDLRERLLFMAGKVEEMISFTTRSLVERDSVLARRMIDADREVNRFEVDTDDLCLRLLALRQPAASDLRFITLALKIVTDLERIGDECVNIAERAIELNQEPQLKPLIDLPRMAEIAQEMVHDALDAFVAGDAESAVEICKRDDEVDRLNLQIFRELVSFMIEDPRTITRATQLIAIAKHLERIADHGTNIAEMVVFMVRGKDIRHMSSRDEAEAGFRGART